MAPLSVNANTLNASSVRTASASTVVGGASDYAFRHVFLQSLALSGTEQQIFGGKVLSSRTRHSGNRVAAHLRLAAVTVGHTQAALGVFYHCLSARIGKAKASTTPTPERPSTRNAKDGACSEISSGERSRGDPFCRRQFPRRRR
jgi:hypothetical protein